MDISQSLSLQPSSRTQWIRTWFAERLKLVENCLEVRADEVRMWRMFDELVSEEAKRIDELDARTAHHPGIPHWLDGLLLELSAKMNDKSLTDVERILSNATHSQITLAHAQAVVRSNRDVMNRTAEKNAELAGMINKLAPVHFESISMPEGMVGAMTQSLPKPNPMDAIIDGLHGLLYGTARIVQYGGLAALHSFHFKYAEVPKVTGYREQPYSYLVDDFTMESVRAKVLEEVQLGLIPHPEDGTDQILDSIYMERESVTRDEITNEELRVVFKYAKIPSQSSQGNPT